MIRWDFEYCVLESAKGSNTVVTAGQKQALALMHPQFALVVITKLGRYFEISVSMQLSVRLSHVHIIKLHPEDIF